MSDKLERFTRDNREAFDDHTPSPSSWEKIEHGLGQRKATTRLLRLPAFRLSAAAAVIVLLTALAWMFTRPGLDESAETNHGMVATQQDPVVAEIDPQYASMVAQFNQVIEMKQKEIESIEKENPELFRQFAGDIRKLDSTYQVLRNTLPANPNKEQLLQAMISNLQMQIMILNQQLEIIQKVQKPNATKS